MTDTTAKTPTSVKPSPIKRAARDADTPPTGTPTETRSVQWAVKVTDTDIALDAPTTTAKVGSIFKIDSEYMTVTDVSNADNPAVTRGTCGSTAATHEAGASVAIYAPSGAGEGTAPGADGDAEGEGSVQALGTTAEFTVSQVITNEQAIAAGQEPPYPDVPMPEDEAQESAVAFAAGAPAPLPAKFGSTQPGDLGLRVGGPHERTDRPVFDRSKMKTLKPGDVEDKYPGETVKMNFPHPVNLTLDNSTIAQYPAGHYDVPVSVAETHAGVLKNSGATKVEDAPYKEPPATLHGFAEKTAPRKKE